MAKSTTKGLYDEVVGSTRVGPLFSAFPYPTKISPESIALFIGTHTQPGDTVFDGFAGSGTTGLGAILCANPTNDLKKRAARLGMKPNWGPRTAILYELGVLGSFISRNLCSPPDPDEFALAAKRLLVMAEQEYAWLYTSRDPKGREAVLRYVVWSEVVKCPSCARKTSIWDACVSTGPAAITKKFRCPSCRERSDLDELQHLSAKRRDDLLGIEIIGRFRAPARIYGSSEAGTWSRPFNVDDRRQLSRIAHHPIPNIVPLIKIPWGDLYRSGYHEGITHLHHLYTRRNLIAFGALWSLVDEQPPQLRDALRFWLLSYNASHTTLMTRIVAKKGSKDLVVTSAQSGVLYVSSLPVEKNVFAGVRRKLTTIRRAFDITRQHPDIVKVHNASCLSVDVPDGVIDYVFTDPPFGGNIPYSEVNFINEAWLGSHTEKQDEVIVSVSQNKTLDSYRELLTRAFAELYRILRKNGKITMVFHSSSSDVWNALVRAYSSVGFSVERMNILDKKQGSFKQITAEGAVSGDPILLLSKKKQRKSPRNLDISTLISMIVKKAQSAKDSKELSPPRLFGRFVSFYVTHNREVPIDANHFYQLLKKMKIRTSKTIHG